MSEIITFRLSDDDPDEQRALDVLRQWQRAGKSTREIITRALIVGEGLPLFEARADPSPALVDDLRAALSEARALVETLRGGMQTIPPSPVQADDLALKASFLAGVKAGVKPGMKRKG